MAGIAEGIYWATDNGAKVINLSLGGTTSSSSLASAVNYAWNRGVVVVAALVAVIPPLVFGGEWHEWIYKGLAILLIGCPCALVISTPAAIAASQIGRAHV